MMITMSQARAAWREGTAAGEGYAPPRNEESIADAVHAMVADEGGELVLRRTTPTEVSVVRVAGRLIAIGGDSMGYSAWCVDITHEETSGDDAPESGPYPPHDELTCCERTCCGCGARECECECPREADESEVES